MSRRSARGQSLVELALTLPLLLIILLGVVDLGRVYFSYMTVINAAREGARYGAANPNDSTGAINHAQNEATGSGITLTSVTMSCPNGCTQGNPFRATVSYSFQLMTTYIFGGTTIPLQAFTEMEIFGQ
jgi:Flp pilus assembly protein TadG